MLSNTPVSNAISKTMLIISGNKNRSTAAIRRLPKFIPAFLIASSSDWRDALAKSSPPNTITKIGAINMIRLKISCIMFDPSLVVKSEQLTGLPENGSTTIYPHY